MGWESTYLARPVRRRPTPLHRSVRRNQLQLRVRVAVVRARVVARGSACDRRFACFCLRAQQRPEAGVLGRVESRFAAPLKVLGEGEGEEGAQEGQERGGFHGCLLGEAGGMMVVMETERGGDI